jgi:hypothetical protein
VAEVAGGGSSRVPAAAAVAEVGAAAEAEAEAGALRVAGAVSPTGAVFGAVPGCAGAEADPRAWLTGVPGETTPEGRVAATSVCGPVEPGPAAATPAQAPEPRTTTIRLASSSFRPPSRGGRACRRRSLPSGRIPLAGLAPARTAAAASTYAPEPSRSRPVGVSRITPFWLAGTAGTAGERREVSRVSGSRLSSMVGTVRGDGLERSASTAGMRSVRGTGRRTSRPWGDGALPGRLSEEHT